MEVSDKKTGIYLVMILTGRLDVGTAPLFDDALQARLDGGATQIVIDMTGVDYISSAGLRSILIGAKKARALSGDIRFCGMQSMVAEVFSISGFESMFSIFATVDEAVA